MWVINSSSFQPLLMTRAFSPTVFPCVCVLRGQPAKLVPCNILNSPCPVTAFVILFSCLECPSLGSPTVLNFLLLEMYTDTSNYHRLSGIKQLYFHFSQTLETKNWNHFHWAKVKVSTDLVPLRSSREESISIPFPASGDHEQPLAGVPFLSYDSSFLFPSPVLLSNLTLPSFYKDT